MGQIPEIHNGLSPTIKHNIISSNSTKYLYVIRQRSDNGWHDKWSQSSLYSI